jgi:hypothetical protein
MADMMPDQGGNQPITIDAVVALLRDDRLRGFRIDIETDQMVEADENAEKQRRIELATAMGGMIQQAAPLIMSPVGTAIAPMVGEVIMFALRGFKAGRQVEETFEKGIDTLVQSLGKQPQQQPDPAAQVKLQTEQLKQQGIARKQQGDVQVAAMKVEAEREKLAIDQQRNQMDLEHMQAEHAFRLQKSQQDAVLQQQRAQMQEREAMMRAAQPLGPER